MKNNIANFHRKTLQGMNLCKAPVEQELSLGSSNFYVGGVQ